MSGTGRQRGQVLVLFALSALFIAGVVGMVIDAGMGYHQERIQANAAALSARAGTVYLSENQATASDAQVECVVTLYASTSEYQQLAAGGRCQPASGLPGNRGFVDFANPVKGAAGAWYVDSAGNELVAVGSLNSALPVVGYLQSAYGDQVAGVRVYSAVDARTYFIRLLGITTVHVAASAGYRMGAVNAFTPGTPLNATVPNPSGAMQNGLFTFPVAFSQQSFTAAGLQNPASAPVIQNFTANDGAAGFFWSSLQCQSMSNADTKGWLQGQNPCPGAGSSIASTQAPNAQCASGGPGPASCVSTQPGIRAVDYRLSDPYVGQVVIVPIVSSASRQTQNPVVQFAFFYLAGYNAQGANGYISGYFIDPALMPTVPGPVGNGAGPGGVGGI